MLPGIRFLLAAIILTMSILIFGLGAAALLRAAHEEVANVPARRVMPEPVFAQQADPPATLAMLRIEPAAPEKAPDMPPMAMPAPEPVPEAIPVPKVETENLAALKLDDVAPAETAAPEPAATPEVAATPETAAAEIPAPLPAAPEPPPAAETTLAALDAPPSPPVVEAAPVPFEPIAPPAMTDASLPVTKTAALGDAAKTGNPVEAKAGEQPDRSEIRKKQRAERARERRRQAARRARLATQQAAVAQQPTDPFSQALLATQQAQPTATTRRHR
ncbi:MAG TPA: hypothetical protein VGD96_15950 [Bradyrhizobium sp.]